MILWGEEMMIVIYNHMHSILLWVLGSEIIVTTLGNAVDSVLASKYQEPRPSSPCNYQLYRERVYFTGL